MTQIEIITGLDDVSIEPAAYQIADRIILTDARLPKLRSFALDYKAEWSYSAARLPAEEGNGSIIYAGRGWIANSWRQVECRRAASGYHLRVVGLSAFWISGSGQYIALVEKEDRIAKELLMQAAFGAPLVLALALQRVFALHVSLVQLGDRYLAFAGESGEGKSTLARFLGFEGGKAWQRIIDDMLPVRVRPTGEVEALPHFPQLKVAADAQPVHLTPPKVPLSVLYVLDRKSEAANSSVQIEAMTRRVATLAVVQHTIAARLFDQHLLADHLAFCDFFSSAVPVRRLSYRRSFDQLPSVRAAVEDDLVMLHDDLSVETVE